jgi:NAD(P)-dependent dehydrogenase (short-subunit alcohol dehydrogenase family)
LADKVAVITGSSSGIGLLSTVELAKAGFRVVATMRNLGRREKLDKAVADAQVRDRVDVRELDITHLDTIPTFVEELKKDYRTLDVLMNNAAFAMAGFAEDISLDSVREQFETNFFAQVALTKAVLPVMRKQRSGHILMISSIGGRVASPVIGAYDGSKFALEGWSEALRLETQSLGIRVVLIEPGAFQTDIWDRNANMTSLKEKTANFSRAERFQTMVNAMRKADAQPVAELIAKIARDPNPRLRYVIGVDAHVQLWLRRILPWKAWEKMMVSMTKIH